MKWAAVPLVSESHYRMYSAKYGNTIKAVPAVWNGKFGRVGVSSRAFEKKKYNKVNQN